MQVRGKLKSQTWENGLKPNFRPDFGSFGPNLGLHFFSYVLRLLDVRHCYKLSLYRISRKTNEPNFRKWKKKLILGSILARLAQIIPLKNLSWVLSLLDLRHCCWVSLYVISRKINEPNLRWQKSAFVSH